MALEDIYGYGYESSTSTGYMPYSHNYNPDYDYPIPNWADPRWAPTTKSQSTTVYGLPQRTPQLAETLPVPQNYRFLWVFLGLLVLLAVLVGVFDTS